MDILTIRAATEADLAALLDLYQHLNPGDARADPSRAAAVFRQFQTHSGSMILLGQVGPDPVATCTLVVVPNLTRGGAPYGLIEHVVTAAAFRGQGHGKAVLAAAVAAAWAQGCYKVMLLTGATRPETLAFYRGAGFVQDKTGFQIRNPMAVSSLPSQQRPPSPCGRVQLPIRT